MTPEVLHQWCQRLVNIEGELFLSPTLPFPSPLPISPPTPPLELGFV